MKAICLILASILDSEVVPLAETLGSVIILDVHFVFEWTNFHNFSEITTFKSGFEDQSLVGWERLLFDFLGGLALRWLFHLVVIDPVVWF